MTRVVTAVKLGGVSSRYSMASAMQTPVVVAINANSRFRKLRISTSRSPSDSC